MRVTVGKHTAADDATVHPLVAEALARRDQAAAAAQGDEAPARSGSTGWPEPPPSGGGAVGWPDDTRAEPQEPASGGAEGAGTPVPAQPRRSWRRLFGTSPAA